MEMECRTILFALLMLSPFAFGAVDWSATATSAVIGAPVVVGSTAIFTTYEGEIYALSADTGAVLWVYEIADTVLLGAQVFDEGTVAVVTSKGKLILIGISDGKSVCETGFGMMPTSLATGNGQTVVATENSIRAFDSSCKQTWKLSIQSLAGQIGADGSNAYFTTGGDLYSIVISSGVVNWIAKTGDSFLSTPIESNGTVYFGSTDRKIYTVDKKHGYVRWAYETGGWVMGTPKPTEMAVYFSSNDGYFYALNKKGGMIFKTSLPDGSWSQPKTYALKNGMAVVFSSNDGNIHVLDGLSGKELWSFSSYGKPEGVTPYKQSFLFGTSVGKMYSLSSSPTCGFTWPHQMESIGNWIVDFEGQASANSGISSVEVRVAEGQWQLADGTEKWKASLDMRGLGLGATRVECRATDNSGKTERGEYSSITLVKSDNAALQKLFILAPSESRVDENITIVVKDSRGMELSSVDVIVDEERITLNSPILITLTNEGVNQIVVEKQGFEQAVFKINVNRGEGSPIPAFLVVGAIAAAGAFFVFRKMTQK